MENIVILRLGWCLKRWVSSVFFESQAHGKASTVTDCWIFFALNSDLPQIYLYMLMPQFNLSDLPRGHCVAKWGLSWGVTDTRWKDTLSDFHANPTTETAEMKTQKRISGPMKVAGIAWGWEFSWWRLECKLLSVFCCLLFFWHTYELLSNSFWLIR